MKKREAAGSESQSFDNPRGRQKGLLCDIENLATEFAELPVRETPASKIRFRVMNKDLPEILNRWIFSEGILSEEYLIKFFTEIYSGQ